MRLLVGLVAMSGVVMAGAAVRVDALVRPNQQVHVAATATPIGPQVGPQLRDVPFWATQVIVRRGAEGVVETRGRVARNSDGSTYVELIDERTKLPAEVLIFDVPNHRELVLDLKNRSYRVLAAPSLASREVPLNFAAEQLEAGLARKDKLVSSVAQGSEVTWKGLGVKRIGGLEAVGRVEVSRPVAAPGEARDLPAVVDESWLSVDLGIAVLRTRHDPLTDEDTQLALTEILRAEPDARMFEVPAGFVLDDGRAGLVVPGKR